MVDPIASDEFTRLRLKRAGLRIGDPELSAGGAPAFVGKVTSSASSIAVGRFLLVQPTSVLGVEAEGGAGMIMALQGPTVPVFLLGPGKPATGDALICRFVDHRWVAERPNTHNGSTPGPVTIPTCFCTATPRTLMMTSDDPSCNHGMFQSCTIQYGPTPPEFSALHLGPNSFISLQTFPDPILGGALFNYYLSCQYNQFTLTRLYASCPYGSPYRDGILYLWLIGGPGNTCSPFHLTTGQPYQGSDATCSVKIDFA